MKQEKSSTANVGQKEEKPFNLGRNILKTFAVCVTVPKYRDTASEDIVSVKYNSQTGTLAKDNESS